MALSKEKQNEKNIIWECQTNPNPWDTNEEAEWTPYSHDKSLIIEEAYTSGKHEIILDENYCINLRYFIQQYIDDSYGQRPIRRRIIMNLSLIDKKIVNTISCSFTQRLSTPLGLACSCNITTDTNLHGSPFIQRWVLSFNQGNVNIKFDKLFPVLKEGLTKEGMIQNPDQIDEILKLLIKVQEDTLGKSSDKKMDELERCCANLYTKDCYIYRSLNNALCSNDQSKLYTLGPYAYVLFNFIGKKAQKKFSIRDQCRKIIPKKKVEKTILYRTDRSFGNNVETYRQAIGDTTKHFKWLQFVSTSRDENVALTFPGDILYKIYMQSYSSIEDQITDMVEFSDMPHEKEVLLLPGVIFTVDRIYFDHQIKRHIIYIQIHSSYIHKIQS